MFLFRENSARGLIISPTSSVYIFPSPLAISMLLKSHPAILNVAVMTVKILVKILSSPIPNKLRNATLSCFWVVSSLSSWAVAYLISLNCLKVFANALHATSDSLQACWNRLRFCVLDVCEIKNQEHFSSYYPTKARLLCLSCCNTLLGSMQRCPVFPTEPKGSFLCSPV